MEAAHRNMEGEAFIGTRENASCDHGRVNGVSPRLRHVFGEVVGWVKRGANISGLFPYRQSSV